MAYQLMPLQVMVKDPQLLQEDPVAELGDVIIPRHVVVNQEVTRRVGYQVALMKVQVFVLWASHELRRKVYLQILEVGL